MSKLTNLKKEAQQLNKKEQFVEEEKSKETLDSSENQVEMEEIFTEPEKEITELTDEAINEWKKQHGKIFKIVIDEEVYIFRNLKRREYVDAMAIEDEDTNKSIYLRQNHIAKEVLLFPGKTVAEEKLTNYAGIAGIISDEAILRSGFKTSEVEEL